MTNIVERLRASLIEELRDQAEGNDLYSEAADEIERLLERLRDGSFSVDLCREAADEIERLRERVAELQASSAQMEPRHAGDDLCPPLKEET